jgi:methyl-accepting chemotaxis protein
MKFRRSAPAVSIAAVVLVLFGSAWATSRLFASLLEEIEADRFSLMEAVATKTIADAQEKAIGTAELVARLGSVRAGLEAGDRDGLLRELGDTFAFQKERFGLRKAEFATPPATMFLRLHNPAQGIGEDVSAFRPNLVRANTAHQPEMGASVSHSGPAIAGIAPVTASSGAHLGTVEFGLDYGPLLDGMKSTYGLDAALLFDDAMLREIATKLPAATLAESNRVGSYLRFYDTHAERMRGLVTDEDVSGSSRRFVRDVQGVTYGVVVLPVTDYADQPIGLLAVAGDFSSSRSSATRMLVWQGLLVLLGSVVSAGVILVSIRGLVLRPLLLLQTRMEALAAGDRTQAVDAEALGLCEEMTTFAAAYEAVRKSGSDS